MADLWSSLSDEYRQIVSAVVEKLGSLEDDRVLAQILGERYSRWVDMREAFEKAGYPPTETIVELTFASNLLAWVAGAGACDGEVTHEELDRAWSVTSVMGARLGLSVVRYRRFDHHNANSHHECITTFVTDESWFGGAETGALSSALRLCGGIDRHWPECSLLERFANMVRMALDDVLEVGGVSAEEHHYRSLFDGVVIDVASAFSNKNKRKKSQTPFAQEGVQHAARAAATFDPADAPPDEVLAEALQELGSLIGLSAVKAEVNRLTAYLKVQKARREHGLRESNRTLHFVFTGNPGTGKTTVARIISKVLYGFGLLERVNLVECDRSELVGAYVGQTAIKTDEVIESALDGVLFIDEAYTLAPADNAGDYGSEAIQTLLKRMEDDRRRLVVIVAGYPQLMHDFIYANPGLKSRFTRYITFDDFSPEHMCRILEKFCADEEYQLSPAARARASLLFHLAHHFRDEHFGNARFVRNVFEEALGHQSHRIAALPEDLLDKQTLLTLEGDDISLQRISQIDPNRLNLSQAKWTTRCPGCDKTGSVSQRFLGRRVTCKCETAFVVPWWNLLPETVGGMPAGMG